MQGAVDLFLDSCVPNVPAIMRQHVEKIKQEFTSRALHQTPSSSSSSSSVSALTSTFLNKARTVAERQSALSFKLTGACVGHSGWWPTPDTTLGTGVFLVLAADMKGDKPLFSVKWVPGCVPHELHALAQDLAPLASLTKKVWRRGENLVLSPSVLEGSASYLRVVLEGPGVGPLLSLPVISKNESRPMDHGHAFELSLYWCLGSAIAELCLASLRSFSGPQNRTAVDAVERRLALSSRTADWLRSLPEASKINVLGAKGAEVIEKLGPEAFSLQLVPLIANGDDAVVAAHAFELASRAFASECESSLASEETLEAEKKASEARRKLAESKKKRSKKDKGDAGGAGSGAGLGKSNEKSGAGPLSAADGGSAFPEDIAAVVVSEVIDQALRVISFIEEDGTGTDLPDGARCLDILQRFRRQHRKRFNSVLADVLSIHRVRPNTRDQAESQVMLTIQRTNRYIDQHKADFASALSDIIALREQVGEDADHAGKLAPTDRPSRKDDMKPISSPAAQKEDDKDDDKSASASYSVSTPVVVVVEEEDDEGGDGRVGVVVVGGGGGGGGGAIGAASPAPAGCGDGMQGEGEISLGTGLESSSREGSGAESQQSNGGVGCGGEGSSPVEAGVGGNQNYQTSVKEVDSPSTSNSTAPPPKQDILPPETPPNLRAWMFRMLHEDIEEMAGMLRFVEEKRQPWQMAVVQHMQETIQLLWPGAWVEAFGSFATGLSAPFSDVDLLVCGDIGGTGRTHAMRMLEQALRSQAWVQSVTAIESAAVPVIKVTTAPVPISFGNTGGVIKLDISFSSADHAGLATCSLVRGFVDRYPPLVPLTLVLKQFLSEKGLNDPYTGGLSSYGLVIMVVNFLQRHIPGPGAGRQRTSESYELGSLFFNFLECFSSRRFKPELHGVSTRAGGALLDRARQDARFVTHPILLEDPINPTNNVGRSCFGIAQIQRTMADALAAVEARCEAHQGALPAGVSILGAVFATPHHRNVTRLVQQIWCPMETRTVTTPRRRMVDPQPNSEQSSDQHTDDNSSTAADYIPRTTSHLSRSLTPLPQQELLELQQQQQLKQQEHLSQLPQQQNGIRTVLRPPPSERAGVNYDSHDAFFRPFGARRHQQQQLKQEQIAEHTQEQLQPELSSHERFAQLQRAQIQQAHTQTAIWADHAFRMLVSVEKGLFPGGVPGLCPGCGLRKGNHLSSCPIHALTSAYPEILAARRGSSF